jgi:hypothetical protein
VLLSIPVFLFPGAARTSLEGVNTLGLAYLSEASIIAVLDHRGPRSSRCSTS